MVAMPAVRKVHGIRQVRVRRGFRGRMVVQIRREVTYHNYFDGSQVGETSMTAWLDADANNLMEVREVMNFLEHKPA